MIRAVNDNGRWFAEVDREESFCVACSRELNEDLLSMVVEGRRTAAAERISLPVAFEIKESFPTSASIQVG